MRDHSPQHADDLEGYRYHNSNSDHPREVPPVQRDVPLSPYNYHPVTLEEEAGNGGWLPGARPTSTPPVLQGDDPRLNQSKQPIDLLTIGMRGEPGWDDDPQYLEDGSGQVTHPDPK